MRGRRPLSVEGSEQARTWPPRIGVSYKVQLRKLQTLPWAVVTIKETTGADGKTYEMACLHVRQMHGWLVIGHVGHTLGPHLAGRRGVVSAGFARFAGFPHPRSIYKTPQFLAREGVNRTLQTIQTLHIHAALLATQLKTFVRSLPASSIQRPPTTRLRDRFRRRPGRLRSRLGDELGDGLSSQFRAFRSAFSER